MAEKKLVVSLALKSGNYKQEISSINKNTRLLKSEFEAAKAGSENFENSLTGQQAKLKLLTGTLENAKKSFKVYASEIEKAENVLEQATKAYESQIDVVETLQKQLDDYTAAYGKSSEAVKNLEKQLKQEEKTLENNRKAVVNASNSITELKTKSNNCAREITNLYGEVMQCETEIQQFESGVREAGQSLEDFQNEAEKTSKSLKDLTAGDFAEVGQGLMDVGDKVSEAGGKIINSLKGAVEKSDEFEQATNQLQATLGLTAEDAEEFAGIIKNVYADNFGESIMDVANGVSEVSKQLRLSGDELQIVTEKAFTLRDVFGAEINESVRSVDTLMKQFGLTADEAMNLITQGYQQNLDFSGEFLDSINEYSVHFKQIGFDAEDMFNILLDGASNGSWNLDKVGDAMKELGIVIREASDDSRQALTDLGLSYEEIEQAFTSGGEAGREAFYSIIDALEAVEDPIERNRLGVELFATMYEDLGETAVLALNDMSDGFNRTIDTAQELMDIKYDSLGDALAGIGRSFEGITTKIGDSLLPILEQATPIIQKVVDKLINWIDANPQLVSALAIAAGAIGGLLSVLGPVVSMIGMASIAFSGLPALMGAVSASMLPVLGVIALVVGAVVALALSIKENWEGIKAATNNLIETCKPYFETLKITFEQVWNTIQDIYNTIIQPLFKLIGEIIAEAINFATPLLLSLMNVFQIVMDAINLAWNTIAKPAVMAIMTTLETVWGIVKPILSSLSSLFKSVMDIIYSAWNNIAKPAIDGIGGVFSGMWSTVSEILGSFKEGFRNAFDTVISLVERFKNALSSIKEAIKNVTGSIGNFIGGIFGRSMEIGVETAEVNTPALNGSYYTAETAKSRNYAKQSLAATGVNIQPVNNNNSENLLNILANILQQNNAQLINAISNIEIAANDIYLDGNKVGKSVSGVVDRQLGKNSTRRVW